MSEAPTPDQVPGAPHPRDTARLFGQGAADAEFLHAFGSGRLHHAWLLTGPRGVGKATLAWAIARFLIATPEDEGDGLFGAPPPPTTLTIDPEHPVARRMVTGGIIEHMCGAGRSVLLASHSTADVERCADRVALFAKGRVTETLTVDALRARSADADLEDALVATAAEGRAA